MLFVLMNTENPPLVQTKEKAQVEKKSSIEKPTGSPAFLAFLEGVVNLPTEEKIRACLDFMKLALDEGKAPRFKDFWECKHFCLPLFKESLASATRSFLWNAYIEISNEARRIKEILNEQSTFAMEQIDLAIGAVEKDVETYEAHLALLPQYGLPEMPNFLYQKQDFYNGLQRELYLLNTLAARVNGLRKEVIKTEMRIRFKNRFFERLSLAGDKIFPKRKELIKTLSTEFSQDVNAFVQHNFANQPSSDSGTPLFELRNEIKSLQELAKNLTLDTQSFTETRLHLSQCWDDLKNKEKKFKKEVAEKKQEFQKNVESVLEKIKGLALKCSQETCSEEEAHKLSSEILAYMRTIDLGRDEVRFLKGEIQNAQQPIFDRQKKEQEERTRQYQETQRLRKEKLELVRLELTGVLERADSMGTEELTEVREAYAKKLKLLGLSMTEKGVFDELLKNIRERILEKKELAMMNLSKDAQASLEQLESLLKERQIQKKEVKAMVDSYSKELAGSGFDFEKAMHLNELITAEKARLENIVGAIEEIEEKIAALVD